MERRQVLPIPIGKAWRFFGSLRNLARITPPDMGFAIREPVLGFRTTKPQRLFNVGGGTGTEARAA